MTELLWPITTIDFEASGLGEDTYPIEIGVARWHGPETPILVWSSLVEPTLAWRTRLRWDPGSVDIHHIERTRLDGAPRPASIMAHLNALCPLGTLAFCDGGSYDRHWMQQLAQAGGTAPALLLGSWAHLLQHLDADDQDRFTKYKMARTLAHRAGDDAVDHLKALAIAIGKKMPDVITWTPERRS